MLRLENLIWKSKKILWVQNASGKIRVWANGQHTCTLESRSEKEWVKGSGWRHKREETNIDQREPGQSTTRHREPTTGFALFKTQQQQHYTIQHFHPCRSFNPPRPPFSKSKLPLSQCTLTIPAKSVGRGGCGGASPEEVVLRAATTQLFHLPLALKL